MLQQVLRFGGAALVVLLSGAASGQLKELRPGVWAGRDLSTLPVPASGHQVYLLGEIHGVRETVEVFSEYLAILHARAGLRDVAVEEDAVHQEAAESYVEGRSSAVPEPLCLRSGVLRAIRRFNEGRSPGDLMRVHLVDIDSPAAAIRQHLVAVKRRLPRASAVQVPDTAQIRDEGLGTVDELQKRAVEPETLAELRTIRQSIGAYRQGLEIGERGFKGSPYLDDREDAISGNIQDLLRGPDCPAVLALYGADHVSKSPRGDGGPSRDRPFSPLALRLEGAGVDVFSVVAFPLSGRTRWRGRDGALPWSASDGHLADGETLDHVLAAAPRASLLYVDPMRQSVQLPSRDISEYAVDAFLLLATGTAMKDDCARP
jgi:hypothetical protein